MTLRRSRTDSVGLGTSSVFTSSNSIRKSRFSWWGTGNRESAAGGAVPVTNLRYYDGANPPDFDVIQITGSRTLNHSESNRFTSNRSDHRRGGFISEHSVESVAVRDGVLVCTGSTTHLSRLCLRPSAKRGRTAPGSRIDNKELVGCVL